MLMNKILKIVVASLFLLSATGCGDQNSNTNGSLSLSVSAPANAGVINVAATALLTPAAVGSEVFFSAKQYGTNPSTGLIETTESYAIKLPTDKSGNVTWAVNFINVTYMDTTLEVTASSGGLQKTVQVSIAKYVP